MPTVHHSAFVWLLSLACLMSVSAQVVSKQLHLAWTDQQ